MPNALITLVRWIKGGVRSRPIVVQFDKSCIQVARPGDVVIFQLQREISAEGRLRIVEDAVPKLRTLAPGVRFVFTSGVDGALVLPTSKAEGGQQ